MVHGSTVGFFRSSRGLRQGDPLSPYLFIMVSDMLSKMISNEERDYISGFKVGSGTVFISHLQFVNDTIFSMMRT